MTEAKEILAIVIVALACPLLLPFMIDTNCSEKPNN